MGDAVCRQNHARYRHRALAGGEIKGNSNAATVRQHRLENLRTRLMEDETRFSELARDYPTADIQHLRQLRRNAIKETQQNKPPRAYRELFRELRALTGGVDHAMAPRADAIDRRPAIRYGEESVFCSTAL